MRSKPYNCIAIVGHNRLEAEVLGLTSIRLYTNSIRVSTSEFIELSTSTPARIANGVSSLSSHLSLPLLLPLFHLHHPFTSVISFKSCRASLQLVLVMHLLDLLPMVTPTAESPIPPNREVTMPKQAEQVQMVDRMGTCHSKISTVL